MMTLKEIRRALADKNLAYVACRINMSRQQLWAIANGQNGNPTNSTMQRISDYLTGDNEGSADD